MVRRIRGLGLGFPFSQGFLSDSYRLKSDSCYALFARQLFLSDHLPEFERLQILRILRDTLPGLPNAW
jgi:hypothetical protein